MAGDFWRTPIEVVKFIDERFGDLVIDLCSSDENKVCEFNLIEEDDFLDDDWISRCIVDAGDHCYCNPPYSNPLPFVKQCVKWSSAGYAVTMLLNYDPSTRWFELINEHAAVIMPIVGGRLAFLNGDGEAVKGNSKPQFICHFAPFSRAAAAPAFEHVHISEIYK